MHILADKLWAINQESFDDILDLVGKVNDIEEENILLKKELEDLQIEKGKLLADKTIIDCLERELIEVKKSHCEALGNFLVTKQEYETLYEEYNNLLCEHKILKLKGQNMP